MNPIKIGLIGLGVVGSGTFNVLKRNQEEIRRRAGRGIEIAMVAVRNVDKARALVDGGCEVVSDPALVVNHPDIDIVVELIGGIELPKELVLKAIANGKHVVTANKALLALHGNEIFAAAQARGVMVAFEAAVAGGIPIIKALREGLTANRIESVAGIINGTTNFILSEMRDKRLDFGTVLKQAQALGYAESDPTFDIEGVDAAHKLTIMSAIAFGIPVQFEKAHVEGISNLQAIDIRYAEQLGYRIKLLGITKRAVVDGVEGIELRVHPTLIPTKRLIANVEGAMNAVLVQADAVGASLYYGKGADRLVGDCRPGRHHPPGHRRPGQPRAAPGVPAEPDDGRSDLADGRDHHQLLPARVREKPPGRDGRPDPHPGRRAHIDRRRAAEGAGRKRDAPGYRHADPPDPGKEHRRRDRQDRSAGNRGRSRRQDPHGKPSLID